METWRALISFRWKYKRFFDIQKMKYTMQLHTLIGIQEGYHDTKAEYK